MKKCVELLIAAVGAALFAGCVSAPFQPPMGLAGITRAPLSTEGNWKSGSRHGKAEAACLLGIAAWGDCSVTAAAANGGLKRVDYLDYDYTNVIGIWQKVVVHAYGE